MIISEKLPIASNMIRSKTKWLYILCVLVNVIASAIPRWPFMRRISADWRSCQTLLTSFWFQKEGISLFHPQLPLFGPPWEVPFEFPLYQALSVIFSTITHVHLTASSRVVSVGVFYVSAFFLLVICLEVLGNKALSIIIFVIYLWLP